MGGEDTGGEKERREGVRAGRYGQNQIPRY